MNTKSYLKTCVVFAYIFAAYNVACSGYIKTEILFVQWGNGPKQLKINEPIVEESETGNQYLIPGGGPHQGFVDMNDIFYFGSRNPGYFKAFDLSGNVRINFDPQAPNYHDSLFGTSLERFYIDSLSRIYFESLGPRDFVAIADTNGNLLDRLNPLGVGSRVNVNMVGVNSDDVISFSCWNNGFYTYSNGMFTEGGTSAWKARDGFYYYALRANSPNIRFYKFPRATLGGGFEDLDTLLIPFTGNSDGFIFLGLDDSLKIYLLTVTNIPGSNISNYGIQIFSNAFVLKDEINFDPTNENRFMWHVSEPFVRRDGSIYEFRCKDDGLHVIKWTRQ